MQKLLILLYGFLISASMLKSQPHMYTIQGTLEGQYQGKIYLFFEGNYRQRDSIAVDVQQGHFRFTGIVKMPVLARLHLDQHSFIADFYLDGPSVELACKTVQDIDQQQDTLNRLEIVSVKGSGEEQLRQAFLDWERDTLNRLPDSAQQDSYYNQLKNYIISHPAVKSSAYLLGRSRNLSYIQFRELQRLLDPALTASFEYRSVKSLSESLAKAANSLPGTPFFSFNLSDSSGKMIRLDQFRGKYVYVVFWAYWCGPCRAEHPALNTLYNQYKGENFEMIGISLDNIASRNKWTQAIVKDQLHWPQVIDPDGFKGALASYYSLQAIPASFLLDPEGKIIEVGPSLDILHRYLDKN